MSKQHIIDKVIKTESLAGFAVNFEVFLSVPDMKFNVQFSKELLQQLDVDDEYALYAISNGIADEISKQVLAELKEISKQGKIQTFHPGGFVPAGTAIGSIGPDPGSFVPNKLKKLVPGLSHMVKCPSGDCTSISYSTHNNTLDSVIIHLNDVHKWTREQIADWLETLDVDLTFKEGSNE